MPWGVIEQQVLQQTNCISQGLCRRSSIDTYVDILLDIAARSGDFSSYSRTRLEFSVIRHASLNNMMLIHFVFVFLELRVVESRPIATRKLTDKVTADLPDAVEMPTSSSTL